MYVVYYNCYFYKHLKPYVPRWISTDDTPISSSKSIKSNSTAQSPGNTSINMVQSMVICSKFKEEEESRLEIIKSMERIVSLFE